MSKKKRKLKVSGKLPHHLKKQMKLWRAGVRTFPEEYVHYHKAKARAKLGYVLRRFTPKVTKTYMDDAGDLDGMRVLHVEVETYSGKKWTLRWNDSHGSGCFFKQKTGEGGGFVPAYEEDMK